MLKLAVTATLLASAAAFSSAPRTNGRRAMTMAAEKSAALPFLPKPEYLDGSMPGDVGFDPLRLAALDPKRLPQIVPPAASMAKGQVPTLYWMREAELKHGRLAMLALVGFAAVDMGFHFPGAQYEGLTSATAHDVMVANGNMGFLFCVVAVIELVTSVAIFQAGAGSDRLPGDFALDPLNYCSTPEKAAKARLQEITHSRLAMLAFGGMVTQAVAVGDKFPYMG